MDVISYVVVFSGGYEAPSYFATHDENEARHKMAEWIEVSDEDEGDTVDLLRIVDRNGVTKPDYFVERFTIESTNEKWVEA
jgi:hypothetical protein